MSSVASLAGLFTPVPSEGHHQVVRIEGTIPHFVLGTWAMNGPARFERAGFAYNHWLDGDGMLRAVKFSDGHASLTSRWVRSRKWLDEEQAGRPLYRSFGTAFPGDRLNRHGVGIESPANVSVYPFAGKLLAFGEQGLPWAVDPVTLETDGIYTYAGDLNEVSPFSAHPSIDEATGELFNFGISFSASNPCLNFYRFDAGGRMLARRRVPIPHPSSVHDFALGPRHAVVYLSPDTLDMSVLLGGGSVIDALTWHPGDNATLLVLDRQRGDKVATITIDNGYSLHVVNCFEAEGELVLDLLELEQPIYPEYQVMPGLFENVGPARPVRYRLDVDSSQVIERQVVASGCLYDFPAIDARRARRSTQHSWMVGISTTGRPGAKFLDRLVRVDWESRSMDDVYQLPEGCFMASEPMVVPDPGDDTRSAVLCRMINLDKRSDHVLVFDGFDLDAGPVATVDLPIVTPPSFHGCWLPGRPIGG